MISDEGIRRSRLQLRWETLLSSGQIWRWVCREEKSMLPNDPGVYRWIYPATDSGLSIAYVGEAGKLSKRVPVYLNEGSKQLHNVKDSKSADTYLAREDLQRALRDNHRVATLRNGVRLARICKNSGCEECSVQLERLRIDEEDVILGIEISENLFADEVGRVFLESLSILQMQKSYKVDNRNPSMIGKGLATKLPTLKRPAPVRRGSQDNEREELVQFAERAGYSDPSLAQQELATRTAQGKFSLR